MSNNHRQRTSLPLGQSEGLDMILEAVESSRLQFIYSTMLHNARTAAMKEFLSKSELFDEFKSAASDACGIAKKPKDPISNIDAVDVDNELATVEYIEDICKFYKLAEIMDVGPLNWHKTSFVPTKADTLVVVFRRWLNKYAGTQVDFGTKFSKLLPPTPPREQLFDRYWFHTDTLNCSSCSVAYRGLNTLGIAQHVISIASIGIVAAGYYVYGCKEQPTMHGYSMLCGFEMVGSLYLQNFPIS